MAHVYQFYEEALQMETCVLNSCAKYNEDSSRLQWAATIIQSYWRGYLVRKELKKLQTAAVVIQKHVRGWLHRYRLPNVLAEFYDSICLEFYQRCAVRIQALWKGYRVRMYEVRIKDVIEMKKKTQEANEEIKKKMQQPFGEMGLDKYHTNSNYLRKVFNVLLDRHHLLSTQQNKGVLSTNGSDELSVLEMLLKKIPWTNYIKELHKIYNEHYSDQTPIKYKYSDKKLRKQEDLLRHRRPSDRKTSNLADLTSTYVIREKLFDLNTKITRKPYERYMNLVGEYTRPIQNITRDEDCTKNVSETDFNLDTLRNLALESNVPPYYIDFWLDECRCNRF